MSSKNPRGRLLDIIDNADKTMRSVADMGEATFLRDGKARDATESCLARTSEAVVTISVEPMAAIMPNLSVANLRGFGNVLRHAYDDIDPALIYRMVREETPALQGAAQCALDS
jgi:uncharacterized protein with HEPN domain